jgi:hypothetical protein
VSCTQLLFEVPRCLSGVAELHPSTFLGCSVFRYFSCIALRGSKGFILFIRSRYSKESPQGNHAPL